MAHSSIFGQILRDNELQISEINLVYVNWRKVQLEHLIKAHLSSLIEAKWNVLSRTWNWEESWKLDSSERLSEGKWGNGTWLGQKVSNNNFCFSPYNLIRNKRQASGGKNGSSDFSTSLSDLTEFASSELNSEMRNSAT